KKPGACNLPRLKDIVVPAEAGIQARSGAPCAQMPGLRPTPERRSSVAHRHEKAARFEFGEAQLHRRPGGGRDPGKKRRARRAEAWTPAYAGATKVGYHSIAKIIAKSCALAICRDSKTSSSRRRPGSRQKHGALCAQRPALRPTPERRRWVCSPGVGKLPGAFP